MVSAVPSSQSLTSGTRHTDVRVPGVTDDSSAEEILRALKTLPANDTRAIELQERLVSLYQPLLHRIARRYSGRGEPYEDLRQTALLGLVKAINGYDPYRGKFISYLLPTVTGEIKRHFRDHTWAVRVPRRQQEQRGQLNRLRMEFQQEHARAPQTCELAASLGLSEQEVNELVQASEAYSALSLDSPDPQNEEGTTLEDTLGKDDVSLDLVVERESLRPALACLTQRERAILNLRFFGDRTQSEIAEHIGCSQMHVSRLLSGVIEKIRTRIGDDEDLSRD